MCSSFLRTFNTTDFESFSETSQRTLSVSLPFRHVDVTHYTHGIYKIIYFTTNDSLYEVSILNSNNEISGSILELVDFGYLGYSSNIISVSVDTLYIGSGNIYPYVTVGYPGYIKMYQRDGYNFVERASLSHNGMSDYSMLYINDFHTIMTYVSSPGGGGFITTIGPATSKINIGDKWFYIDSMKINIGNVWKDVVGLQVNVLDTWKISYTGITS